MTLKIEKDWAKAERSQPTVFAIMPDDTTSAKVIKPPTFQEMKRFIDGFVERVKVLDYVDNNGKFHYTYMFVDEEGLLKDLPKNAIATKIYQRNIRYQYPNEKDPFCKADEDFHKELRQRGFTVIDRTVGLPNYTKSNPSIAGRAIYFQGYTCDEVDELLDQDITE